MRFGPVLLLLAGCTWAATSPTAVEEANAGLALAREGKYELAIPHYRAAIAADSHLPGLYLNLGLAYFKLNQLAQAAPVFEQAAKADPNGFQARTLLGLTYYGLRQFKAAAANLKLAAAQQPDNVELRFRLAQSYMWSKQYQGAVDEFRFLLARKPDSAPVHMLLGEVLDAANQKDQAIAEFEAAVKAGPHEPQVHFGLGYLYWTRKRYDDAARELRAELANYPDNLRARAYLGDCEMHAGDAAAAEKDLRQVTRAAPEIRLAHVDLGILLSDNKDTAREAEHQFREAIRLDPSKPDAHYRLGKLWQSLGREQEAEAEFEKVKKLADSGPEPLLNVPDRGKPAP